MDNIYTMTQFFKESTANLQSNDILTEKGIFMQRSKTNLLQ